MSISHLVQTKSRQEGKVGLCPHEAVITAEMPGDRARACMSISWLAHSACTIGAGFILLGSEWIISILRLLCFAFLAAFAHLCDPDEDEQDRPDDIKDRPGKDIEIREQCDDADDDERKRHDFVVAAWLLIVFSVHDCFCSL